MIIKAVEAEFNTSDYMSSGVCVELMRGKKAFARAKITGTQSFPEVRGMTEFFRTPLGILICAHVQNLPWNKSDLFAAMPYGFAISENEAEVNKLPDIFGNGGYAWCTVLAPNLSTDDICGKAICIKESQPKKTTTKKIAYGVINRV